MANTIPLAQYLFGRLRQLNCHSIHGVPGDFMLRALDFLPASGVRWIGNANELCAGYAADGYARAAAGARMSASKGLSRSSIASEGRSCLAPRVGALFTTYGVGELSAINAVAGSYAESVPVVHFVGTPSRSQWAERKCVHHSLGDGNLGVYAGMAKQITCAQADLNCEHVEEAVDRYDEIIAECVKQSRPVYVNLPSDMVSKPVERSLLERHLDLDSLANDPVEEEEVVSIILSRIQKARRPLIIADGLSYQWDFVDEVNEMVRLTNILAVCYSAGKGVLDESLPSWAGSLAGPTESSQTTDMAMLFGPLLSDTNTAAWSAIPDPSVSISFGLNQVELAGQVHHIRVKPLLKKLVQRLRETSNVQRVTPQPVDTPQKGPQAPPPCHSASIEQDTFWQRMSSWLVPHDTVILANGTPLIGGRDMHLPTPTQVIASGIWCSIGQMLPAAQGIAAAKQDHSLPGRTILFEADGSFQVTCQSLSDIIRYRLDVTIFLVNNAGYAYERWLNGMDAEYNDVPAWRYTDAPGFFGAEKGSEEYPVYCRRVETWGVLEAVLADGRIVDGKGLKLIDIKMGPSDVPEAAKAGLRRAGEALRAT